MPVILSSSDFVDFSMFTCKRHNIFLLGRLFFCESDDDDLYALRNANLGSK